MAEWLRRGALVCITTEGSVVRIASALMFFAFLFLSLFSIASAFVHCVKLRQRGQHSFLNKIRFYMARGNIFNKISSHIKGGKQDNKIASLKL